MNARYEPRVVIATTTWDRVPVAFRADGTVTLGGEVIARGLSEAERADIAGSVGVHDASEVRGLIARRRQSVYLRATESEVRP